MKRPEAIIALSAAVAAPLVLVGRTTEHAGRFRLRKAVGSGMMRLVWNSSPPSGGALRSGKTNEGSLGSVSAGALPTLSLHVWKCMASVGPMLRAIRNASG